MSRVVVLFASGGVVTLSSAFAIVDSVQGTLDDGSETLVRLGPGDSATFLPEERATA